MKLFSTVNNFCRSVKVKNNKVPTIVLMHFTVCVLLLLFMYCLVFILFRAACSSPSIYRDIVSFNRNTASAGMCCCMCCAIYNNNLCCTVGFAVMPVIFLHGRHNVKVVGVLFLVVAFELFPHIRRMQNFLKVL